MKKKRVVVLGAGISGLASAYALLPKHEVTLLEKNAHSGGVMHGVNAEDFFFENGPRTFRTKNSPHLQMLITKLGLIDQVIGSCAHAKTRYILFQQKLHAVPASLWAFCRSPLCKGVPRQLFREWRKPSITRDETVYDFAVRRFGIEVASRFFDSIALGVFGSDARLLSVASAFPRLKEWESRYGSVTGGLLRALLRKRSSHKPFIEAPLFSLRQGTPQLTQALERELTGTLRSYEEALILQKQNAFIIETSSANYTADTVISALPPHAIGKLIQDLAPHAAKLLMSIPMTSMTIVHVGYRNRVLPCNGFGYLVPTSEREKLMGVVFDSEIFPEQNQGEQTRLTLMLQGLCGEEAIAIAKDALQRHLGIRQIPDVIYVRENKEALPLMEVGHMQKIRAIQQELARTIPTLHLVGNYLGSPSVEHCVARALEIAHTI